ncbi:hypothetical protein GCM10022223_66130 [Kineosporia mesophila]|uniref:Uncharacterized protein n=1 Tax=Kineosporia mesophila TaxID=566012 RepID=A0ABP7AR78_9ACTN
MRLSGRSLIWRAAALAAGTLLVINGSVFGNDVYWPFGPMSQFAFRTGTNDVIRSTFLAAVDEDGMLQRVTLSPANLGIARAEIEGQQPRFVREPDMLSDLAANYRRIHPGVPELTQLWLCEKVTKLHNGRDAGSTTQTVVGWPENSQVPADLPEFGGLKVPYRAGTDSTPGSSPGSSPTSSPSSTEAAQ